MAGLMAILYALVLHGFLRASAAGLITDVPGQLGILYAVLRLRYGREPWTALGWFPPATPMYWFIAALSGISLAALAIAIENPGRLQIHAHDIGYRCRRRQRSSRLPRLLRWLTPRWLS